MTRALAWVSVAALAVLTAVTPALAQSTQRATTQDVAQSSRPRIEVYPRPSNPGPNAKRHCEARLVQEFRPSGTVIVPVMNCWWQ